MRTPELRRAIRASLAVALAASLSACGDGAEPLPRQAPPSTSERLVVNAGEFRAGGPVAERTVRNPLADATGSHARGKQLYVWFNCAGCHGLHGGGGMGPPLLDADWIYGSDPASVFQTIAQGRPNGMPAFGGKLPDAELWHLVTYVRSLGGADSTVRPGGTSGMSPTEAQRLRRGQ